MCKEGAAGADAKVAFELPAVAAHGLQPSASEDGAGEAGAAGGQVTHALNEAFTDTTGSNTGSLETDPTPDSTDAAAVPQRYELLHIVGSGTFGTVFLAMDRDTN